jgi:hypothetical protein
VCPQADERPYGLLKPFIPLADGTMIFRRERHDGYLTFLLVWSGRVCTRPTSMSCSRS